MVGKRAPQSQQWWGDPGSFSPKRKGFAFFMFSVGAEIRKRFFIISETLLTFYAYWRFSISLICTAVLLNIKYIQIY